jgi:predicted acyl esterase
MRDGLTLKADVFRPDDRERHPAIPTVFHQSDYPSYLDRPVIPIR